MPQSYSMPILKTGLMSPKLALIPKQGLRVSVPCEVKNGFFSDEALIRIESAEMKNPIVAYVNKRMITERDGKTFVYGVVMRIPRSAEASVFFQGEVISGNNPVTLPLSLLMKHTLSEGSEKTD